MDKRLVLQNNKILFLSFILFLSSFFFVIFYLYLEDSKPASILPIPVKTFGNTVTTPKFVSKTSEFEKLPSIYRITYGNDQAPIKIVEFFSFQCPHCVRLFRKDFARIKEELIDTGKASFEFHPVPQDLTTIQAMICFQELTDKQKALFLEAIFEETDPVDPELTAKLMMAAMNVFKKPMPQLDNPEFLKTQPIFETVYNFIKQKKIYAVPCVEVNGHFLPTEIPDYHFIKKLMKD